MRRRKDNRQMLPGRRPAGRTRRLREFVIGAPAQGGAMVRQPSGLWVMARLLPDPSQAGKRTTDHPPEPCASMPTARTRVGCQALGPMLSTPAEQTSAGVQTTPNPSLGVGKSGPEVPCAPDVSRQLEVHDAGWWYVFAPLRNAAMAAALFRRQSSLWTELNQTNPSKP